MTALQKEIWKSILRMFNLRDPAVFQTKDVARSKPANSKLVSAIGLYYKVEDGVQSHSQEQLEQRFDANQKVRSLCSSCDTMTYKFPLAQMHAASLSGGSCSRTGGVDKRRGSPEIGGCQCQIAPVAPYASKIEGRGTPCLAI